MPTAIVTGASQGIGAGIVKGFVERGFDIVANSRKMTQSTEVAASDHVALVDRDIGDPAKVPMPVAMSISSDDKMLWVTTFADGSVRGYDITDPHHPKQTYEKVIGHQVNMVSQSWDGTRVYFTS